MSIVNPARPAAAVAFLFRVWVACPVTNGAFSTVVVVVCTTVVVSEAACFTLLSVSSLLIVVVFFLVVVVVDVDVVEVDEVVVVDVVVIVTHSSPIQAFSSGHPHLLHLSASSPP